MRMAALAALALVACGGSEATVPHERDWSALPPVDKTVAVRFDGRVAEVEVAAVPHEAREVPVLEIFRTAFPLVDPSALRFELVGSDGFRPSSKPRCSRPLTGDDVARFRIDVATHDVAIANVPGDDDAYPGCYRVHHVIAMTVGR